MNTNEKAEATVKSGVLPITVEYKSHRIFETKRTVLRSSLIINSLELGVLTYNEYRFVAARNKKGDELTKRHIEKLFKAYRETTAENPEADMITFKVFTKTLVSGALSAMLFELFKKNPDVNASRICVEISADVLFEELSPIKEKIKELRDMGVKIAISELGEEFSPVFRLSELDFDIAFADALKPSSFDEEEISTAAASLPELLHRMKAAVILPFELSDKALKRAIDAGYDGAYSSVKEDANSGG